MKIVHALVATLSLSLLPTLVHPGRNKDAAWPDADAAFSILLECLADINLHQTGFITKKHEERFDQFLRVLGFLNLPSVINEISFNSLSGYHSTTQKKMLALRVIILFAGAHLAHNEKMVKKLELLIPGIEKFLSLESTSRGNIVFYHLPRVVESRLAKPCLDIKKSTIKLFDPN